MLIAAETSSILGFSMDILFRSTFARIVLSMIFVLLVAEVCARQINPFPSLWENLPNPPDKESVMVLGNSMFKTGLNFQELEQLSHENVEFNYYNGYYTNLFLLISKNALAIAPEKPKLVIWGFRPHYAQYPAFRRFELGHISDFITDTDSEVSELLQLDSITARGSVLRTIEERSRLVASRASIQENLQIELKGTAIDLLCAAARFASIENPFESWRRLPVSDILVSATSHGLVQMAEEKVDDGTARKFVTGDRVQFPESLVPRIALTLQDSEIPQLVVIHKPVAAAKGRLSTQERIFTDQAIEFFEREQIAYVNLLDDPLISIDMYASGDHYNINGRNLVTQRISSTMRNLLK